jgi:hypothetical protein
MRLLAISLAGLLLITAPIASQQSKNLHENTDVYSGLWTVMLETSVHTCPGDPSPGPRDPELHLLFIASENPNNTVSYYLTPELDRGALSLRPKGTMDALLDGQVFNLTTYTGSIFVAQRWLDHSTPHEGIPFLVAEADLERLSKAQTFQFRVNGPRQGVQRCADAKRLRDLAEFLTTVKQYNVPEQALDAGPSPLVENADPSTKLKTLTLQGISTQACPGAFGLGPRDADVHLIISANQRTDGGVWYFITTDISQGPPLGLPKGSKLRTQIAGISGTFNTINGSVLSSRSDLTGKPLWDETTAFHVHQSDLMPLTHGAGLDLRIDTPAGEVRRCADPGQFQHFGEFIHLAAGYEASH